MDDEIQERLQRKLDEDVRVMASRAACAIKKIQAGERLDDRDRDIASLAYLMLAICDALATHSAVELLKPEGD